MCKVHSIELSKLFTLNSPADFFFKPFIWHDVFSQQEGEGATKHKEEEGNWTKWFMQRIRLELKRTFFRVMLSANESSD